MGYELTTIWIHQIPLIGCILYSMYVVDLYTKSIDIRKKFASNYDNLAFIQ